MKFHLGYIQSLTKSLSARFSDAEVFLVGGAVRDLIMNHPIGDLDVVVRNVPLKALVKFLKTQGKANLVGKNFGVIKFFPKDSDKSLDIALPRTDHAFNTGGYRDVKVAYDHKLPIEKDLERRDFTCNAIALQVSPKSKVQSPKNTKEILRPASPELPPRLGEAGQRGERAQDDKTTHYSLLTTHSNLIDPFNGLKDIQIKIIRAVGNPEKRFKEDYTRMLRALRFSCQLGFKVEKKTWGSIRKNVKKINESLKVRKSPRRSKGRGGQSPKVEFKVARELVAKELLKGVYHDPVKMLELMDRSGLLKELIPELLPMKRCKQDAKWHSEGNVLRHTMLALQLVHNFKLLILNFKSKKQLLNYSITQLLSNFSIQETLELYLGILFHDIGKPSTFGHEKKRDKEAITYYGHESVGAQMTRNICERLKLSAPEEYGVDVEHIVWCVKNHMLLHPENVSKMRNATLEKYFFNSKVVGKVLLGVCFFDGLASVPKGKKSHKVIKSESQRVLKSWPSLQGWWTTATRLKKLSRGRKELPKPLLNGDEIMKILKIKPGPEVGKIIEALREAQLSGKVKDKKSAETYIRKIG